jgi:hypothetical protein
MELSLLLEFIDQHINGKCVTLSKVELEEILIFTG